MKNRYLLISEVFPPKTGGSGRWFWDLYSRLPSDSVVVLTDEVENSNEHDASLSLTVERMRLANENWGFLSLSGLRFYFSVVKKVLKLIKLHEISSIHCGRTLHEGVVGLIVNRLTGKRYLCYVHGEDIEMCWSSREYGIILNAVLKYADTVICNSYNSLELLKKWKSFDEQKTHVLHPGVDASSFTTSDHSSVTSDQNRDQKLILTVSRLQPRKGHDMLIRAMPMIIDRHPEAKYVIVGSGSQESILKNLITELGLEKYISLAGECSDEEMQKWYRRADLFVLPNRTIGNDVEGFGIVLLEAQASGTPVIAGDSGGTRETMSIGETGFIVDCRTPDGLADKISDLFDNPNQLQDMGVKSRKWVESKFDWPVILSSAQDIFSRMATKS